MKRLILIVGVLFSCLVANAQAKPVDKTESRFQEDVPISDWPYYIAAQVSYSSPEIEKVAGPFFYNIGGVNIKTRYEFAVLAARLSYYGVPLIHKQSNHLKLREMIYALVKEFEPEIKKIVPSMADLEQNLEQM